MIPRTALRVRVYANSLEFSIVAECEVLNFCGVLPKQLQKKDEHSQHMGMTRTGCMEGGIEERFYDETHD